MQKLKWFATSIGITTVENILRHSLKKIGEICMYLFHIMEPIQNQPNTIILFDKNIGIITPSEVIITNGKKQKKIEINSINKVVLKKSRVFFTNIALSLTSLMLIAFVVLFLNTFKTAIYSGLLFGSIGILIFSIFHKFYIYKIEFMKKKEVVFQYNTSQYKKESIKEFYVCIRSVLKEQQKKTTKIQIQLA